MIKKPNTNPWLGAIPFSILIQFGSFFSSSFTGSSELKSNLALIKTGKNLSALHNV